MDWLAITIVAYFLLALEIILDKFLLSSSRVSHPAIYAFYSGTMGLFAIFFAPFGFHAISYYKIVFSFIAGMIFIYGMLSLFFAIRKGEASRVLPVVGAVIPITTFFLAIFFLEERLGLRGFLGIATLISGGLLISFDLAKDKTQLFFKGFRASILAGFFLALSATLIKALYNQDNFVNVFIWTRIGAFLGVISFLVFPVWRKSILGSMLKFKKPAKDEKKSGISFILAKSLGGSGSILKEKATSMVAASVTVVNALVSVEYVFIFVLSVIFSAWVPEVMQEKKDLRSVAQKIVAIVVIALGLFLVYKI
jgi:drug/metabolite transporter (DMT)-like permease